jgi:hypothetical protein
VPAARLVGLGGLLAFLTFNAGWIAGDFAQPGVFSPANDDISDLGALTASSPWLYNQLAANLSGLLVVALGVALWRALSPSKLGRVGAAALIATGTGTFLDGIFRLDCQGIDVGCQNDSWHFPRPQNRVGFHHRRDLRRLGDPRIGVSANPRVARFVAANARRPASDLPRQPRVLADWQRRSNACPNGRCVRSDRLHRIPSSPE